MLNVKVWIPELNLPGEVLSPGYVVSLIGYNDLGIRYEVYMNNEDFIEVSDDDGSL